MRLVILVFLASLVSLVSFGCGASSNSVPSTALNSPTLLPPALPARLESAVDPRKEANEDVASPDDLTFQVPLRQGWNALALQVDFVTQIVAGPEVIGFTTYENGQYAEALPLTTSTVNRGEGTSLGLLIYCDSDTVLTYRGTPPQGLGYAGLEPGWNLVTPPSQNLSELGWNGTIYEVDSAGLALAGDSQADPSLPIWIYTSVNTLLKLPSDTDTISEPLVITGDLAPLSSKDYPDSEILCDHTKSQSAVRLMAYERNTRWNPGTTLNVLFLDGNNVPDHIYNAVGQLLRDNFEAHCNLRFSYEKGPAQPNTAYHITVRFLADEGYSSQLGKQSLGTNPSMFLSRLYKEPTDGGEFRNTVLHEFGHALGMGHEHQSPNAKIQWNKPFIYKDLAGPPNGWNRETIDNNMFTLVDSDLASPFDPLSIMMYPFTTDYTTDGFSSKDSPQVSEVDIEWLKKAYPYPAETRNLQPSSP